MQRHSLKLKLSCEWIQVTARHLAHAEGHETFVASNKWLNLFMDRFDLMLRRTTTLKTLSDNELVSLTINYMNYLRTHCPTFASSRTISMDETSLFFEGTRLKPVDVIGARHFVLKSTGFSPMRVTVILAVTAPGKKLLPGVF